MDVQIPPFQRFSTTSLPSTYHSIISITMKKNSGKSRYLLFPFLPKFALVPMRFGRLSTKSHFLLVITKKHKQHHKTSKDGEKGGKSDFKLGFSSKLCSGPWNFCLNYCAINNSLLGIKAHYIIAEWLSEARYRNVEKDICDQNNVFGKIQPKKILKRTELIFLHFRSISSKTNYLLFKAGFYSVNNIFYPSR